MSERIDAQGAARPQTVLKLGSMTLTGRYAAIVALLLLAAVAAGLVYIKPTLRMSVAGAIWIAFIVYWSVAAKGAGPKKSSESRASRAVHERLLNGSLLLLFVPVPGLRERYWPVATSIVATGLTLETGSALLAVWARRHLGRNWSAAVSVTRDHELVNSGPYRLVRHPIYTGMLGMFLGTAVVSGELHALIAVAVISVAYWRKIRLEDQTLRETFGGAYDAYRRRTWSLVPWLY